MRDAVAHGARRLLMAIGGSATNDGGMGMLAALGARFYDDAGNELAGSGGDLEKVASVDLSRLPALEITVICDVTNPLLGSSGATRVYGPQKGAAGEPLESLERGMENYLSVLKRAGCADGAFPGAGAAGGMGYALKGVLGAEMKSGIDAVLDAVNFDSLIEGVDLVVTGEGRLDGQSVLYGKVPTGIAKRCAARGIPVIAVVGGLGAGAEAYYEMGLTSLQPISDGPRTLESSISEAEDLISRAAERLFRTLKIGMSFKNP